MLLVAPGPAGGASASLIGVKMLKLKPQRTLDSMQETKEWFSDLTSSLGK